MIFMSLKYRYLNHTADIEYVAYGNNKRSLFANALYGMFNVIADIKKINSILVKSKNKNKLILHSKKLKIREASSNLEELLWRVLQDALSLSDADQLFFYDVKNIKIIRKKNIFYFNALLFGLNKFEKVSKFDVKGVSMQGMKIKKIKDRLIVHVILDV